MPVTTVIQKKTGLLLGWCDEKYVGGLGLRVPYVCEFSPFTFMRFRWRFPNPNGSDPQIIAHGNRDAGLLRGFKSCP